MVNGINIFPILLGLPKPTEELVEEESSDESEHTQIFSSSKVPTTFKPKGGKSMKTTPQKKNLAQGDTSSIMEPINEEN